MSQPNPDHIKAIAKTSDLLAAIERFEAVDCDFGGVSTSYIRAFTADRHRETFRHGGVEFMTEHLPAVLLILMHAAKPGPAGEQTLRPFAELLVTQNVRHVRLVSPVYWQAHLEVTRDSERWVKLIPKEPPTPTTEPTEVTADVPVS